LLLGELHRLRRRAWRDRAMRPQVRRTATGRYIFHGHIVSARASQPHLRATRVLAELQDPFRVAPNLLWARPLRALPADHGTILTALLTEGVAVAVAGVDFVGLRSEQFSEMVRLFRDVIGVPLTREPSGMAGFRLGAGTVLEIYGPADEFHSFFTTGPVVGLRVGNFDAVRALMLSAGVAFIGAAQHASGMSWQHFRCPDGTVLEIIGPGRDPAVTNTEFR